MAISTLGVQTTAAPRITEAVLDKSCDEGDGPGDELLEWLFARKWCGQAELDHILREGCAPAGPVREAWEAFAAAIALPPGDEDLLKRGREIFVDWGPQIVVALCFGSLAGGYAAYRVSHLLVGASHLKDSARRRAFETTQFLFDVMGEGAMKPRPGSQPPGGPVIHTMQDGGMKPGQRGLESAQRVRLMHAGIRRLVRQRSGGGDWLGPNDAVYWRAAWGAPINQEHMMGTILLMSVHVVDCLKTQWVPLNPREEWAYVYTWLRVGRVMGVKEDLMPKDLEEARQLWSLIRERHYAWSEPNARLETALLDGMAPLFPHYFRRPGPRGYVCKLNGAEVADMVGIKRTHRDRFWFWWWWNAQRVLTWLEVRSKFLRRHLASAGTTFVRNLYTRGLDGQRTPFAVPTKLPSDWALEGQGFKPWVRQLPGYGYVSEHLPRPRWPRRGTGP
jgi:hypothetical protein